MAKIGRNNTLTVLETSEHGLYLDGGPHAKILLPNRYVTKDMTVGTEVDVFLYNDSEDRLVATTETPFAQAGEFAYLEVVGTNPKAGAFLDWGLSKDLLLPFREQGNIRFRVGDGAIVAVYLDKYTNRVVASTRLHQHLAKEKPNYEANQPVDLLIYGDSPLGYKAIVDKRYRGLLLHEETSDQLEEGDQITGYVKKVHNDGKIDLRRDPFGRGRVTQIRASVLEQLEKAGGILPYNDKSSPESIREAFNISKKAFKQALSSLYKDRTIRITDSGIERVTTDSN
jgi:predicted RNA-binding protein (virulence factor B family)